MSSTKQTFPTLPFLSLSVILLLSVVLPRHAVHAAFRCVNDDTIATTTPTNDEQLSVANESAIDVFNCTFNVAVSLANATHVSIRNSTFKKDLTIVRDGTTPLSGTVELDGIVAKGKVLLSGLVLEGPPTLIVQRHRLQQHHQTAYSTANTGGRRDQISVVIANSLLSRLEVADTQMRDGASLVIKNVVVNNIGAEVRNVFASGSNTMFRIENSTFVSRVHSVSYPPPALRLRDVQFSNQSLLLLNRSSFEGIAKYASALQLWVGTNGTYANFLTRCYGDLFITEAELRIVNSRLLAPTAKSIGSFIQDHHDRYRRHRFAHFSTGAIFSAQKSFFDNTVEVFLREGSSTTFDAVSADNAQLVVQGDNPQHINVYLPPKFQVTSLSAMGCTLHMPGCTTSDVDALALAGSSPSCLVLFSKLMKLDGRMTLLPHRTLQFKVHHHDDPNPQKDVARLHLKDIDAPENSNVILRDSNLLGFEMSGRFYNHSKLVISNASFGTFMLGGGELHLSNESAVMLADVSASTISMSNALLGEKCTIEMDNVSVLTNGMTWTAVKASTPTNLISIRNSNIHSHSTVAFIGSALLLKGCVFENGAQLLLQNSNVIATLNAIQLYAMGNATSVKFRGDYFERPFTSGAVFNLTNTTLQSLRSSYAFRPYVETYVTKNHQRRHSRFAQGAKLVATNCRFLSRVDISVEEGATIELDATSYEGIDLTVYGDGSNVVPVPHTMKVQRFVIHSAEVAIQGLTNTPQRWSINTWNVQVVDEFLLSSLHLGQDQHLKLTQPNDLPARRNAKLYLKQLHCLGRCSVSADNMNLSHVTITESTLTSKSKIFFRNTQTMTSFNVLGVAFSRGSSMQLEDSTVHSTTTFSTCTYSGGSWLRVCNCDFIKAVQLKKLNFLSSSGVSIARSTILSAVRLTPSLVLHTSVFQGSTLCIRDTTILGAANGLAMTIMSATPRLSFLNGSAIIVADSIVGLLSGGHSATMSNTRSAANRAAIGGEGDGSNGTTVVFQNSTFRDGPCELFFQGSNTHIWVDSLTLERSELDFSTDVTSSATNANSVSSVTFHVPPVFTANLLRLRGGTVQWRPSNNSIGNTSETPGNLTFAVQVEKTLQFFSPLSLSLSDGETMLVTVSRPQRPLNDPVTITLEGFTAENQSTVVIDGGGLADDESSSPLYRSKIHVGGDAQVFSNSSVHIHSLYLFERCDVQQMVLAKSSSLVLRDAHASQTIQAHELDVQNGSHVVFANISVAGRGVMVSESKFSSRSSLTVLDSEFQTLAALQPSKDAYAMELRSVVFVGNDTLLLVANCSVIAVDQRRTINAAAVLLSYASQLRDGATGVFSNVTLTSPASAFRMSNPPPLLLTPSTTVASLQRYSMVHDATLMLEGITFVGNAQVTTALVGSSTQLVGANLLASGGNGSAIADLFVQGTQFPVSSSGPTPFFGCTANVSVCQDATIMGTVTPLVGDSEWIIAKTLVAAGLNHTNRPPSPSLGDMLNNTTAFDEDVANLTDSKCPAHPALHPVATPTLTAAHPTSSSTRSCSMSHTESLSRSHVSHRVTQSLRSGPTSNSESPKEVSTASTTFTHCDFAHRPTTNVANTASLSISKTIDAPPTSPPTPPPTRKRTVNVRKVSDVLGTDETTADVVTSTAGATTMISASMGSGVGGVVAAMSATKLASCELSQADPKPEFFELPIQFPLGSGPVRWYVGAVVAHALINAVAFVLLVLSRRPLCSEKTTMLRNSDEASPRQRIPRWRRRVINALSMVFTGLHTFFTPNVAGACATVLLYNGSDGSDDETGQASSFERGLSSLALLVVSVVFFVVLVAVHRALANGVRTEEGDEIPVVKREDGRRKRRRHAVRFNAHKRRFVVDERGASDRTTTTSSSAATSSTSDSDSETTDTITTITTSTTTFSKKTRTTSSDSSSFISNSSFASDASNESNLSVMLYYGPPSSTRPSSSSTPPPTTTTKSWSALLFSGRATLHLLLPLFEGCRDFTRSSHRSYASVEVGLAAVIAMVSASAQPLDACKGAAYGVCALACVGIVYAVGVRPYRTYLDTTFSVISYGALVMLSICVVALLSNEDDDSSSNSWAERGLSASLWVISVCSYLNVATSLMWSMYVQHRRQSHYHDCLNTQAITTPLHQQYKSNEEEEELSPILSAPLLPSVLQHDEEGRGTQYNNTDTNGPVNARVDQASNPLL